jgi:hypothetical protein
MLADIVHIQLSLDWMYQTGETPQKISRESGLSVIDWRLFSPSSPVLKNVDEGGQKLQCPI